MAVIVRYRQNGEFDFNQLENSAIELKKQGRHVDAIKIYLYMADGDKSLDGGWLGARLGECYEAIGDLRAAKFWHGRAIEENPELYPESEDARKRLESLSIVPLIVSD